MVDLLKELGAQKGGKSYTQRGGGKDPKNEETEEQNVEGAAVGTMGGRRRRHSKGHKGNSWLTHVKATMKLNRGKSFKQVLKLAKKSYKKSQSQSGGKRHKSCKGQNGGSGGKVAGVGASASPYV
jgi:flagellar hook-basal body complex protein FliE